MSEFLTSDKITLKHFASRKRYKTDSAGNKSAVYDRLYIGLMSGAKPWLANKCDDPRRVLYVFMLGAGNVVFVHDKEKNTLVVNSKAGAQAREYIKAYCAMSGITEYDSVDDLPTAIHTRQSGVKIDSLDALMNNALGKDIELDF